MVSTVSFVTFARPWWLFALLVVVIPPLLALLFRRRSKIPVLSTTLQCLAVVAAVVALADPYLPLGRGAAKQYIFLRDVSASTRGQLEYSLAWPDDLPCVRYDFAASVVRSGGLVDRTATNAGAAIRLAQSQAHRSAGIVIRTDGQFGGDWHEAAASLGRTGVKVTIIPMESPLPDGRIAMIKAYRDADENGKVHLTLSLDSNAPRKRMVTIWRGDDAEKPLLKREELLLGPTTLRLVDVPPGDRAVIYHAKLSPGDDFPENDVASAVVLPVARRIAVIAKEKDSQFVRTLAGETKIPISWLNPSDAPSDAGKWDRFSAVVLVDETGTLLSQNQREALANYVRAGGGLVLVGVGPHATAADRNDPLNRVSALLANPYQRKAMKVTVVLDASGSMAQRTGRRVKFDVAIDAVMSLRRHLTAHDSLAVITFCDKAKRIYDSGSLRIDFTAVRDALARVQSVGPTHVMDALIEANRTKPPKNTLGLVLLVSDLNAKPFEAATAAKLFRKSGQSLAIVATRSGTPGKRPATDLEYLALLLKAPLKHRHSLLGLAEVFAGFLRDSRPSAVRRGRFRLVGPGMPFDVVPRSLPELNAYFLCAETNRAEVLLRAGGDPLLARKRVGLGASVCLAIPGSVLSNPVWRKSSPVRKLLGGAVRWTLRRTKDSRFSGRIVSNVGADTKKFRFRFDARDKTGPMNLLKLKLRASMLPSGGMIREIVLPQVSPGRYEANFDRPDQPFTLVVTDTSGNGKKIWQQAFANLLGQEFSAVGAHWGNLRRLAKLTGGRIVAPQELSSLARQWAKRRGTPIWYWLLAAAVAFMLVDWVITRPWKRLSIDD